jgi:hypothetical protein
MTSETLIGNQRTFGDMTQGGSRPALFVGALIGGVVALAVLFLTDFGGWYNYYYYSGTQVWSYIGIDSPISLLGIAVVCIPLFFALFVSFKGVQDPDSVTMQQVNRAFVASSIQFALIVIAGIVFVVAVSGSDDWWFGTGFYGSVIGVLMMMIFLRMAKQQYTTSAPQAAQQHWPPVQMYGQPGAQPYVPPPAYPAPQQQWQTVQPGGATPTQPTTTRFCVQCGQPLAAGVRFCERCGRPVQ